MKRYKNILLVGGTGRNVGKTELVCRLIRKISSEHKVYALKVSAISPDEELFHGDHSEEESNCHLFEETRRNTNKDTSRMLRAGACRVFYLRSDDAGIETGFAAFEKKIPTDAVVVCESNSLGQFIQPGLYVMVKSEDMIIKPRAKIQMKNADMVIISDGKSGFSEVQKIVFTEAKDWQVVG